MGSAVAALLLLLLYVQAYDAVRSSSRRMGFSSKAVAGKGLEVESVEPGMGAERAGLHVGDLVVRINGEAIRSNDDYHALAARFQRGQAVTFTVERGKDLLDLAPVPGAPFPWKDFLLNLLAVVGYASLGFLALSQAGGDVRARLLFLFGMAVALELSLPNNLPVIGSVSTTISANLVFYLLTGLQVGLELHLASSIPETQPWLRRRPWIVPIYYTLGIAMGLLLAAVYEAEISGRHLASWLTLSAEDLVNYYCLPIWALAVLLLLARPALRHPEPAGRQQALLVLIGSVPWAIFVFASVVAYLRDVSLPGWVDAAQPLILLCYPVAVFVAIFRYQLFDLEFVVRRGLIYTTLTGVLVLVFYGAVGAGGALFSEAVTGTGSVWVISAATLLLGLLFSPLRRSLQTMIDRRFFPERYALREHLVALAGELPALGKVPLMGKHLVQRLAEIFGLRNATLLVADPKTGLLQSVASAGEGDSPELESSLLIAPEDPGMDMLRRSHRPLPAWQLAARSSGLAQRIGAAQAALVVPLRNQDRITGALLLGNKREATGFPAEELELLNLLGHHVAAVFENARLFESATKDGLTGLSRREAILAELDKELLRAVRYRRPLTVGLADLDHFKSINDTYGHLAGDTMLARVALTLKGSLRGADSVGRYGGEEFLLLLPETNLEGATAVAEKMRHQIEATEATFDGGATVRTTISIGLASLAELDGPPTPEALLAAADRSLYRAKQAGRNRVEPAALAAS